MCLAAAIRVILIVTAFASVVGRDFTVVKLGGWKFVVFSFRTFLCQVLMKKNENQPMTVGILTML